MVIVTETILSDVMAKGRAMSVHQIHAVKSVRHNVHHVAFSLGKEIACDLESLKFGELNYGENFFKTSN